MAIIDLVKYNGGPNVFAWKYPSEELSTWTQLIVNESQEAVLYKGGKALDVFGSGRHTLDTANIPLLRGLMGLPFGGQSPFSAEVWFVNKVHALDIKWGTSSPIQLQDPKYGVFVPVRAFGQFGIRIEDSKQFLVKLVGAMPYFDQNNLVRYFRGLYLTKVKDAISSYLIKKQISVMEINAYISELSDHLCEQIRPTLADYGIALVNFYINDISVPDGDPAVKRLKEALSKRAEMNIIGYNYQQERSFDTLEGAATNGGAGGLVGAGLGVGMGVAMGGAVGSAFGGITQMIDTASPAETVRCPKCGAESPKNKRFCAECGSPLAVLCPHCGSPIEGKPKFCPECGGSLKKSCPKCGSAIEGSPKFCPECGSPI